MLAIRPFFVRSGLILVVGCALAACSSVTDATRNFASSIAPYKMEIVQGNFVSKEQAEALKPGMTRAQVREVLGTPLLQSVFHSDRWDYVFTMKRQGLDPQARQLTVYFQNDLVQKIEGDAMPSEAEFVTLLGAQHKVRTVPVLEANEEKLKAFAPKPAAAASAPKAVAQVTAAPAASSYPPLEAPAAP